MTQGSLTGGSITRSRGGRMLIVRFTVTFLCVTFGGVALAQPELQIEWLSLWLWSLFIFEIGRAHV